MNTFILFIIVGFLILSKRITKDRKEYFEWYNQREKLYRR